MSMAAPARSDSRGFALLIVLWALVLLALIVTEMGTSGRLEAKIARNLMGNAVAEAAADGALYETIFHLSDGTDRAWQADGTLRRLTLGPVPVDIRVEDEAGKINPNMASADLLQALMVVVGADKAQAQTVAQAIIDWRGGAQPEQQASIAGQYQAAGLKYQPSFAPFESSDEVGLVLGMTPDLAARLAPHLSVHQIGISDPTKADPIVARALAQLSSPTTPTAPGPPMAYRSVTITAIAHEPGGGRFTRRAVVRLGPGLPRGYALLVWAAPGAE